MALRLRVSLCENGGGWCMCRLCVCVWVWVWVWVCEDSSSLLHCWLYIAHGLTHMPPIWLCA
jgi:hypothetical protein